MTIAFASSGTNGDGTGPLGGLLTTTVAIAAGRTALMGFVSSGVANPAVSAIARGGAWSQLGVKVNGIIRAEVWGTPVNGSTLATDIGISYTGTGDFVIGSVVVYTGVVSYGLVGSASAATANPSLALTTQDANNWLATLFGTTVGGDPTALTGNLREHWGQASSGGSGKQGDLGWVDNTSVSPASVTTAETQSATTAWAALGIELRTVAAGSVLPAPLLGSLFVGPTRC